MANNTTKTDTKPDEVMFPPPTTVAGCESLLVNLQAQQANCSEQLRILAELQGELAPGFAAGDPASKQRVGELESQASKIQLASRLLTTVITQTRLLSEVLRTKEAQEKEQARKKDYEATLMEAMEDARQADAALAEFARCMHTRERALERAQTIALHLHELGALRQLRGQQGPSWAAGYFGIVQYLEAASFQFRNNYMPLAEYSRARLPGYGLNGANDDSGNQARPEQQQNPPAAPKQESGGMAGGKGHIN